jgi:hypothetical protein
MTGARIRLIVTLALFAGWLAWLAVAVYQARHDPNRVPVVSRAQLLAANVLVVAEVRMDPEDGLPASMATVAQVIRGNSISTDQPIPVLNLKSSLPSGAEHFPGAGTYLLPLYFDGSTYRIAGLPLSPGYEQPASGARPRIYPWNSRVEEQLRDLGYFPSES